VGTRRKNKFPLTEWKGTPKWEPPEGKRKRCGMASTGRAGRQERRMKKEQEGTLTEKEFSNKLKRGITQKWKKLPTEKEKFHRQVGKGV